MSSRAVNDPPQVSVILATNRNGPYLADTLASLAAQTLTDWELIVVDDGAPDPEAVEAAVGGIPDAVVVHQANAGVSVARNVGIARSRGRYLAFLDDDDRWAPERLALQVGALERQPEAVAAFCDMAFIDGHGTVSGSTRLTPGDLRSFIRHETRAPIPTLLVTRQALERVGTFHSLLPPGEDLDLIYRLARAGPFAFVPGALVEYRSHGGNETGDLPAVALASRRILWIQRWWSARVGETDLLADVRIGLRRSRGYWTERLVRSALHEARMGHLARARQYGAFVARNDPVTGLVVLGRLVWRKASASGGDRAGRV